MIPFPLPPQNSPFTYVLPVTGANRGIGLGIAECCLVNGASRVYSLDIGKPGEDFQGMSKRFDGRLFPITADVTKEETVTEAINHIIAEAGGLHGMVVNAGKTHHKAALDFTPEEVNNLFAINVCGEEFGPPSSSFRTFMLTIRSYSVPFSVLVPQLVLS